MVVVSTVQGGAGGQVLRSGQSGNMISLWIIVRRNSLRRRLAWACFRSTINFGVAGVWKSCYDRSGRYVGGRDRSWWTGGLLARL